nr:TrkH family potassium uptake protein [uncultured Blautia sp.]
MNYRIIAYIVGWVLNLQAIFMALPSLTAVIYNEEDISAFLITMVICLAMGLPLTRKKPKNKVFHIKDGCVAVALSWFVLSLTGAIPFVLSGSIPHPIDAIFETVSGFTTTGSSILTDVESLSKSVLIWRSFTHWIGGMGVLVFLLSLLPLAGGYHMNLMRAESPGPSVSKLVPKVQSTAKILYSIYLGMTVIQILLLLLGGIPVFDSLCITFGTAGTGGFGIRNDSMGGYSLYCQIVTTIFMILFGVNFSAYYLILTKKFKSAFQIEEIRYYFGIIIATVLLIAINSRHMFSGFGQAIQQSAFQVGSIITTTGYSSTDFNQWPALSKTILVILMFVGACAESTGGGIKVSRIVLLLKAAKKEFQLYLHPNAVKKIKMDKKSVSHETLRSTNIFLSVYLLIFCGSILILSLDNFDMATNFTAIAATLNNIGPGLEIVGPMGNFSSFSYLSKLVMIFDMLAGRLEIFPLMLLFFKGTWKKF